MTRAVVVMPPVCEFRHTCHHLSGTQVLAITGCTVAAIATIWALLFAAAWLSDWWCERCKRR